VHQRIKDKIDQYSVFWKILIANLLLGISVILILALVFIPMMLSAAKSNDAAYEDTLLQAASTVFEEINRNASEGVASVEASEWFHDIFINHVLNEKPLQAYEKDSVAKELSIFSAKYRPILHMTVQYYDAPTTIYTDSGVYENTPFYHEMEPHEIKYVSFPGEEGFDSVTFRGESYLIYRSPLSDVPGGRSKGILNLLYRTNVIQQRLENAINGEATAFHLLDSDGNKLWTCTLRPTQENCATLSLKSPSGKYTVGLDIPMSVHLRTTRQIRWLGLIAILADLIICVFFAIYLSKQNYRPFGVLVQRYADCDPMRSNELVSLSRVMDGLLDEKAQTKAAIEQLRPLARHRILRGILNGSVVLENITAVQRKYCGLSFPYAHFDVIAVQLPFSSAQREPYLESAELGMEMLIDSWAQAAALSAYLYYEDSNHYQILVNHNNELDFRAAVAMLETSCNEYFRLNNSERSVIFGVGTGVWDSGEIYHASEQASTAMNYGALTTNRTVVFFADIQPQVAGSYYYPFSDEMMLARAISDGNAENARSVLQDIIQANRQQHRDVAEGVRYLYSDLISTINRSMLSLGLPIESAELQSQRKYHSLTDVEAHVTTLIERYCQLIRQRKEAKENSLEQRIFDYVESNLNDPDLSLARVAEEFGKSSSYISMVFKQQKEVGYSDYVNQRRIRKATELMLYEQMSIEEACRAVGYVSLTTFRRNFQKFTSRNPREFIDNALAKNMDEK